MNNVLQELGLKNGTDKADKYHTFQGMTYLDVYYNYWAPLHLVTRSVLELGVHQGASLKTWRDFFTNADIWGVDIDPACNRNYGERIRVVTGGQSDPRTVATLPPSFDIIIDDGSHVVDHIVASFELLWPRVKPGGFYVIEDLGCSYVPIGNWKNDWPGMALNTPDTNYDNDRGKINQLVLDRIKTMDSLKGDIRFIHFWPMQIFFYKV